ncbi:MAG: hypothetical protein H0Z28_13125 [Archaeoglobus sp.]|nr:hypothetical protein [Archaeoglobus sp.]
MKRREFLKLLFWVGGTSLGMGCASKPKPKAEVIQTLTPTPSPTLTPTPFLSIDYYQLCDTQKGIINSVVEILSEEKPTVQIKLPYTRKVEVRQEDGKWIARIEHLKPTDYAITIQAGDQQENLTLEGLISQQEYPESLQDTLDQMYHQVIKDHRLGTDIQQKKKTMKKAAQYASHQTPQNPEAIQATLALGHATANKQLPENPDEIYNLVKKINQNPLLWNGAETHSYTDDYGNTFRIYTHNQAEHAWLLSRVLAELEQKHGPKIAQKYGLLTGHVTSWWSQIQQLVKDWDGGGYLRIGHIHPKEGTQRMDITHPDYTDLAVTSTDWYVTLTEQGKTFFPADDHSLQQKFSKPEDRALALQFLAETPFKTWNETCNGTLYGFQAAKAFWNHHVPKARQLTEEVLKTWPMWNNELNILSSFYVMLGDAFFHGEQHSMSKFLGFPPDEDGFYKEWKKLIYSNRDRPDMEAEYFNKYPDAPNVVLSRNSEEWRGVKFVYSVGHIADMYTNKVGWPKKRYDEREERSIVIPVLFAANGLPWTYENTGVFRAEFATTISDKTASLLKQKYGSDLAIGPANLVGPFMSKQAARKDWEKAKQTGGCGGILTEYPQISAHLPRHTQRELPKNGFFIWKA